MNQYESISDERRLRILFVIPELVAHLAIGTFRIVANEVPHSAKVVDANYDPQRRCFAVTLEDDSFEPVAYGAKIPIHPSPQIEQLDWSAAELPVNPCDS